MSESINSQHASRTSADSESQASQPEVRSEELAGGHRLDAPHAAGPSHAIPGARPAAPDADADAGETIVPAQTPVGGKHNREEELLLQASQIAEHLRQQYAELDRRENSLNEHLAALDRERRNVRLAATQHEAETEEREQRLKAREAEFNHKIATCEKLIRELEEQDQQLRERRDNLDAEREGLRGEIQNELHEQRDAIQRDRQALQTEREALEQQIVENQAEQQQALDQIRDQLDAEREALKRGLDEQFEVEHADYLRQRNEWETLRTNQIEEIQQDRELTAEALRRAEHELESKRRDQAARLEQALADHQQQLDELREANQRDCEAQCRELDELRESELGEMQRAMQEFKAQQESEQSAFRRERGTLENRLRFQQEHLDKSRAQLEAASRDFRIEQQQGQLELEQTAALGLLRRVQLDHYRELLEERERSVVRERQLLSNSREELESEINGSRERHRREREVWEEQRQAQRAEIRRQQGVLALHAENLEGRRERLDKLRAELEQTHQSTLEMRMAVEEAWAQLSQSAGPDVARERLDAAREAFPEHFHQLQEAISLQRQELEDARAELRDQQAQMSTTRQEFDEWLAGHEDRIREWEARLAEGSDELETRESGWRSARESWTQEKLEAEAVIRDLLQQLTELTDPDAEQNDDTLDDSQQSFRQAS